MKIKIIKDIPGYKAGEIVTPDADWMFEKEGFRYAIESIIHGGFAEEVKEYEIDMEEIRKQIYRTTCSYCEQSMDKEICSDTAWFTAYRIVKAVIEKLNGEWKATGKSSQKVFYIQFSRMGKCFFSDYWCDASFSMTAIKDQEISQKVIELCEPELKILFGITN